MGLNPLEQLNLITMAAIAAIFLTAFFTLKKVFFTPLIDVMEKREGKLKRAHARYQEADVLIEQAREEAARIAAEAAETAERFSEDVREELAGIRESKRVLAGAEAEKILASGRAEVARLKGTEQARLKEHLLTCSRQTLVKMIPTVDEEALRLAVNQVLTARGAAKQP
jgi:F0F1-type ATP synthase membrane subunit b/b'